MAEKAKKKGNKGIVIGLILLVVFIAVGVVFGLAMSGKINIPGITPKKKPIPAAVAKPKATPSSKTEKPPETKEETKTPIVTSVKQGAVKLAEVWNEMPTGNLVMVVEKWKPSDLALVLNEMDPAKVAEVLAAMKPNVASDVSQQLRAIASQVPTE